MHLPAFALSVDLPVPEVFDLLANEANLPAWLDADRAGFRAGSEVTMRLEADSRSGVVDVWMLDAATGDWEVWSVRLLAATVTRCVVLLTRVTAMQFEGVESAGELARAEARLDRFLSVAGQPLGCGWM